MRKPQIFAMKSAVLQMALACILLGALSAAYAMTDIAVPLPVQQQFAQKPLAAGQGQMRFLGLRIYDARLWVGPGFEAQSFANYPLALELTYHRNFTGKAIAQRSVQEIARQRTLPPDLAQRWTDELTQWLPDVKPGDRLTGLYTPHQGMQLWLGDKALNPINDMELAQRFFGIWLSPQTSEPRLREALLAEISKAAP